MAGRVIPMLGCVLAMAACGASDSSKPLTTPQQQAAQANLAARLTPIGDFAKGGQPCPAEYVCYTSLKAQPTTARGFAGMASGFGVPLSKSQCEAPFRTQGGRLFQHCMGYGRYAHWDVAVLLTVAGQDSQGGQTQLAFAPLRSTQ